MATTRGSAQPTLFDDIAVQGATSGHSVEHYHRRGDHLVRSIKLRSGESVESSVPASSPAVEVTGAAYDVAWLSSKVRPIDDISRGEIRYGDLFSGAGGLSLGVDEAGRALGMDVKHIVAAEIEADYMDVYRDNFNPRVALQAPVEEFVDSRLGAKLSPTERKLSRQVGHLDFIAGGPPCQGHSDLNNHTRRNDPKNALFDRMARFAEIIEPEHVLIENVPGVRHDRSGVFDRTLAWLVRLGYHVDVHTISAQEIGVPQRRQRTLVVASRNPIVREGFLRGTVDTHRTEPRSVGWAIADLLDVKSGHPLDETTKSSAVSQERIDWLFENDEYDLPNELRPDCHRMKSHTYNSVYGRLYWDRPAWTITTGFAVMGQGRFLHPLRRRVITAHEAARLQFLPDFFDFGMRNRKGYAKMVGNAVPPKLAYVVALELLR